MNNEPLRDLVPYLPSNVIPGVVESGPRGERMWDIYSMLLKERIVMLFTPITDPVANTLIAQCCTWRERNRTGTSACTSRARRGHQRRPGDLRYDAAHSAAGIDHLRGHGGQHGHRAALRRRQGQALRSATCHDSHAPGYWRCSRTGIGYGHCSQRDNEAAGYIERNTRQTYRSAVR